MTKKTFKTTNKKRHKLSTKTKLVIISALYIVAIYLIISPLIPRFQSFITSQLDNTKGYKYAGQHIADKIAPLEIDQNQLQPIPKTNTLVIPKIGVDGEIFEGESETTLNKGIWHRPKTSNPGQSSNIVLAAHRYLDITAPNSFYNLDKLEVSDEILVYWKGEEHAYSVTNKKIVPATAIEIEDPTPGEQLTLYTCEPLYSAENRLVITAAPVVADNDTTPQPPAGE